MLNEPIITECNYHVSPSRLWDALTHPVQMRKWFFESMHSFIPEPGFTTRFNVRCRDKVYVHIWRVVEVIPGKRISYRWEYGNYPGSSVVSFDLFQTSNGTALRVIHSGTETFPDDNPDFSRQSCSEGWENFIGKRLKQYLGSNCMKILRI